MEQQPQSVDYGGDDGDGYSDYSTDDEIQYCDCIASTLAHSLPGTPGKKGGWSLVLGLRFGNFHCFVGF